MFRREIQETEKVELLIFVTPHVMGHGLEEKGGFQAQDHFIGEGRAFPGVGKTLEKMRL